MGVRFKSEPHLKLSLLSLILVPLTFGSHLLLALLATLLVRPTTNMTLLNHQLPTHLESTLRSVTELAPWKDLNPSMMLLSLASPQCSKRLLRPRRSRELHLSLPNLTESSVWVSLQSA